MPAGHQRSPWFRYRLCSGKQKDPSPWGERSRTRGSTQIPWRATLTGGRITLVAAYNGAGRGLILERSARSAASVHKPVPRGFSPPSGLGKLSVSDLPSLSPSARVLVLILTFVGR